MMKTWLIAASLGIATSAFAEPPGITPLSEPASPPQTVDGSYRLQIAAVDAGVIAAFAIGHNNGTVDSLALLTYVVGAPIVHLVHDQPTSAVESAGLRLGLPLVGILLGSKLAADPNYPDSDAPIAGAALGAVVGAVVASALDIGVLAKHETGPRVGPAIAPTAHGGMTFGLSGSF
jgi:hypothetical protein